MKRFSLTSIVLLAGLYAILVASALAQHEHPAGDPGKLGKVNFSVSCDPKVQPQFSQAVAMLHSFWYEKARDTFATVAEKDPTCGMAYWGVAMTHYHQIWEAPGPADLNAGLAAAGKAKVAGAKTQRERDYIAAVDTFYKDSDKLDHRTRALAYEKAMELLQTRYPDDHEAAVSVRSHCSQPLLPPTRHTPIKKRRA
jgi:hypothetical protein